jgi:hypothetical protein
MTCISKLICPAPYSSKGSQTSPNAPEVTICPEHKFPLPEELASIFLTLNACNELELVVLVEKVLERFRNERASGSTRVSFLEEIIK